MKKLPWILLCVCVAMTGCQSRVMKKIKYDFGIGEKPEGYEVPSDRAKARLPSVAKTEMKRMNLEGRRGEIKFQQQASYKGKYYKEVKVYEKYTPLEVQAIHHGSDTQRGYVGYISYTYRILQSERKSNKTQAGAAPATIRTTITGSETYRYRFGSSANWDGQAGEHVRR